jgi:glutamate-1-semialdehyde 2,1-aminomutase
LLARAQRVIPNGVSSGGRAAFKEFIVRAKGAYVWNSDEKRYIDYLLAWGPIVIGHCDPRVNEAVARATATCDLNWVGTQAGEIELAEAICHHMPCAEKVAFCTSGTDATLHAVHVVRAATGRDRLLKFHGSYHGWHDNLAVGSRFAYGKVTSLRVDEPNSAGLSPGSVADVIVLEWNDFEGVRAAFQSHGSEFAAVVCEPYVHSYGCVPAEPGFLELLRSLCTGHGAALVFDEVKTGFRAHLGGYQAICGVTPDLTAFGKALGNGYSIAGLAGTAALMDYLGAAAEGKAAMDGTYNASPYALAAGLAVIEILEDGGIDRLHELGQRLRSGLRDAISSANATAVVTGVGSEWAMYFRDQAPTNYNEALDDDHDRHASYVAALLDQGILEPLFAIGDRRLCLATTEADIDQTLEAAAVALERAA